MVTLTFNMAKFDPGKSRAEIVKRGAAGLYRFGEFVMAQSKETFVPVHTGNLRATGHVSPPRVDGIDVVVVLAFGGPSASYAAAVHENLSARHFVGQAKYLEAPISIYVDRMAPFIAAAIRE